MQAAPGSIEELIARMGALLAPIEEALDERRHYLATYLRTTAAVHDDLQSGRFLDAA